MQALDKTKKRMLDFHRESPLNNVLSAEWAGPGQRKSSKNPHGLCDHPVGHRIDGTVWQQALDSRSVALMTPFYLFIAAEAWGPSLGSKSKSGPESP